MTPLPSRRATTILAATIEIGLTFALASVVGFAVLVALFKARVFASVDIIFYRGVILSGLAFAITVAVVAFSLHRLRRGTLRDAVSAGFLSLGLNLSFLVIAPVTVDRSISVFMISYMEAHNGEALSPADIEAAFKTVYLGRFQAIDRRLREQAKSGNVAPTAGDRYQITDQGRAFMRTARFVAWLFDTDTRLVDRTGDMGYEATAQAAPKP